VRRGGYFDVTNGREGRTTRLQELASRETFVEGEKLCFAWWRWWRLHCLDLVLKRYLVWVLRCDCDRWFTRHRRGRAAATLGINLTLAFHLLVADRNFIRVVACLR
jgi:hypothetical protein